MAKSGSFLRRCVLLIFLLFSAQSPALAAVEIAFYSRELGGSFPHAFIRLTGTVDATGAPVDAAYGFTAKAVTPAILLGSVAGEVIVERPSDVSRSDRQFAVTLTDDQYREVLNIVDQWRTRRQPSYNLNRRNCVHFVADMARAVGLRVADAARLMKKPRSFLQHVRTMNPQLGGAAVQAARN